MAKARSEDFPTPLCRLSFAQGLWEARAVNDGAKKYGCTLIFKNKDRASLEKPVRKVIEEEWGEKGLARYDKGAIRSPFLSGTSKEARNKTTGELHPGMGEDVFFIRPQSGEERPPTLRFRSENEPATKDELYSGCHGFAVLNAYAWTHPQSGDGVSFGLRYFQRTQGGDRLAGAPLDPHKWFEQVEDDGDMPEETRSGAGAGGLFG